jgi:4-hydroxybenzoate polyprenyltransferase
MQRYIKAFIKMIKPEDQIGNALAFLTGYISAQFAMDNSLPYALTSTCFVLMAANALNQCTDVETDMVNKPDRPIPSGLISLLEGYIMVAILYASSLALAALVNTTFFALTCFAISLGIMYSIRPFKLKDRLILSNLSIAIGYGTLNFLLGWSVTRPVEYAPLHILIMLTAFDFFANISKDYRDMRGDMISNVRTIPIVIGRSRAIMLEFSALYVVFTLPLMYFITSIDNDYILLLLTPIGLLITYSAHRSVSMYRDVECYKYMMLLYILMRVVIIATYMIR